MNESKLFLYLFPELISNEKNNAVSCVIQWSFLFIILGVAIGVAIWLRKTATESNWKKAWENETPDNPADDLDAEHGSVHDLAEVVATKAEKWAAILPGILLVIGLLGTFLGIGLALDAAAQVLGNSNADPMKQIQDMMPMLEGLGAKFKTSIYGILGFLAFKLWHSIWGKESERLRWCIIQSRQQFFSRKEETIAIEQERHSAMLREIGNIGSQISLAMREELQVNRNVLEKQFKLEEEIHNSILESHTNLMNQLSQNSKETREWNVVELEALRAIKEQAAHSSENTQKILQNENQSLKESLIQIGKSVIEAVEISRTEQTRSAKAVYEKLDSMLATSKDSSNTHRESIELLRSTLKEGLAQLVNSNKEINDSEIDLIISFKQQMAESSEMIRKTIQSENETNHTKLCSHLSDLNKGQITETRKISTAVEVLIDENKKTVQGMFSSSEKIASAAKSLEETINDFGPKIKESANSMVSASNTVGNSSQELSKSISEFGPKVQTTLESIKTNFIKSIDDSSKKMDESAGGIKNAVSEMSKASQLSQERMQSMLSELESNIQKSGEQMTQMIHESSEKMKRMANDIRNASISLGDTSKTTEHTIRDLGKKISEDLADLAFSNSHTSQAIKNFTQTFQAMHTLLDAKFECLISEGKNSTAETHSLKNSSKEISSKLNDLSGKLEIIISNKNDSKLYMHLESIQQTLEMGLEAKS